MTGKIKKLICKCFGHILIEEVYAEKTWLSYPNKYQICKETKCLRCGKTVSFKMSAPKSRAELLQEGWFLENG